MTVEVKQLTADEVRDLIKKRRQLDVEQEIEAISAKYQYVRPFTLAAKGYLDLVTNPEGRFMLGLQDVDAKTRGFGRGELIYITGRAHSGKTQVVMNALNNNPQAKVIFFTPDEVKELILAKLVALRYGVSAEDVERLVKLGDEQMIRLIHQTTEVFRNLIVIDDSLTLQQMRVAVEEARDLWGHHGDAVVIDFLELIPGEADSTGVAQKSQDLKRWTKEVDLPVICLHQASRSSGDRGKAAGMGAMRYGGESEAIFVLEVYRKRENPDLTEHERALEANSVTINVAKNKRPPCHTGEVDYFLDPDTGLIRPFQPDDRTVVRPDRVIEMLGGR